MFTFVCFVITSSLLDPLAVLPHSFCISLSRSPCLSLSLSLSLLFRVLWWDLFSHDVPNNNSESGHRFPDKSIIPILRTNQQFFYSIILQSSNSLDKSTVSSINHSPIIKFSGQINSFLDHSLSNHQFLWTNQPFPQSFILQSSNSPDKSTVFSVN